MYNVFVLSSIPTWPTPPGIKIVSTTVFVIVSITEIEDERRFPTYIRFVTVLNFRETGILPTGIGVPTMVFVVTSITITVLSEGFAT